MTEPYVFILADQTLAGVVQQIKDDQWAMTLPDWFQVGRVQKPDITLRDIINYHAYDDAWVPEVLASKTMAEVGAAHDGDLLGDDPKARFAAITATAAAAVQALTEADLDRPVHLSYGDFPVREYLKHITSFRGFRAYDIAKLIGIDPTLPADLVQGLWGQLEPEIEQWRAMGVFGPAVPVPENADLQTKLIGLVGRQP
jgi:uncharacterized protein (TIGR03086 family)